MPAKYRIGFKGPLTIREAVPNRIHMQNVISNLLSLRSINAKFSTMARTDLNRNALNDFLWNRAFKYLLKNEILHVFNKNIKNILSNFNPHEIGFCNDKYTPWINSKIKSLIKNKNSAYKNYLKKIYISRISSKLTSPTTSSKAYWSILENLMNKKKIK